MFSEFRALAPYLRRYRPRYLVGSVCLLTSVGLKLLIPFLLGDSIDTLRQLATIGDAGLNAVGAGNAPIDAGATAAGNAAAGAAVDAAEIARLVARSAAVIVASAATVALARTLSRILILGTSRRVVHDIRNVFFDHLLRLAPSFYIRNPTGQIMSRVVNDLQYVQGLMGPVIMYLAETTTLFVIGLTIMLQIHPSLTLIGLLPFPIFLYAARRIAVHIQEGSREAQNSLAEISAKVDESLSGQLVIKTLALEDFDRERFEAHCLNYRRLTLRVTKFRSFLIPMMMLLTSISTIVVLGIGGPQVARGEMSLGALVTMMLYMRMLSGPTRTLGFVISSLRRGASALGRINEMMTSEVTLPDPLDGVTLDRDRPIEVRVEHLSLSYPSPMAGVAGGTPQGESMAVVERESATAMESSSTEEAAAMAAAKVAAAEAAARMPGGSAPGAGADGHPERDVDGGAQRDGEAERVVLDDVSITIPAGHTLGIVGHVGSGKTTLVRAIARQLEVEPGHIFFDGVDITHFRLSSLRRGIGFVPQDAFLFSASLAENVALGEPDASLDRIETAIQRAQLARDLPQLPQGLDTVLGERGVNLSGGQRQRTALARVLLLEPPVMILDDTLSAVDTDTADAILAELRPFSRERTSIVVSHRLSTLQHADEIIVLEEGGIVEQGTHDELIALAGRYAALYAQQEQQQDRQARESMLASALDDAGDGSVDR